MKLTMVRSIALSKRVEDEMNLSPDNVGVFSWVTFGFRVFITGLIAGSLLTRLLLPCYNKFPFPL